ncbi:MAG: hypothetical protein ACFFEE_10560 [Candidatus Thorarchaeota archaeon]
MGTESEYPIMLKYTFVLHFLVAWLFGFWLFAIPDTFNAFIGHTTPADAVNIAYGAILIGLGLSSIFAFRAGDWKSVKILVELQLVYCPLAIIGAIYTFVVSTYPVWFLYFYMAIMGLFFILFLIPYYQHKKT